MHFPQWHKSPSVPLSAAKVAAETTPKPSAEAVTETPPKEAAVEAEATEAVEAAQIEAAAAAALAEAAESRTTAAAVAQVEAAAAPGRGCCRRGLCLGVDLCCRLCLRSSHRALQADLCSGHPDRVCLLTQKICICICFLRWCLRHW